MDRATHCPPLSPLLFRGGWQGIAGQFDTSRQKTAPDARKWSSQALRSAVAEGDFAEDVRVHGDAMIGKRLSEQGIVLAQMIDPDGGVDEKLHRFSRCGPACGAAPAQDRAGCLRGAPDGERFPARSGRAELHE